MSIATTPILQFGTSRFLQAHVDLFVDEALEQGRALGHVAIVQTTDSPQSAQRIAAFRSADGYPVRIRGMMAGTVVERERRVRAIGAAYTATRDWAAIRNLVAGEVRVIVSNTGDRGYELKPGDGPHLLAGGVPPASFPAKLLVLLHGRYIACRGPLTICPCELIVNNGDVLRDVVLDLARDWELEAPFRDWLGRECLWVNSLVDRIVSEPIEPVGAVAEPYAIWVVENQPGMVLPCSHPDIVVTERLEPYERRKLFLLNLGHTYLAERWLMEGRARGETVLQAMRDPLLAAQLDLVWEREVLPVFDALGEAEASRAYLAQVRDRFSNPFLAHRIADIAQNHAEKKRRRLQPVVDLAERLLPGLAQPRLRAALEGTTP